MAAASDGGPTCDADVDRVIVHIDCDAFYAQVEELRDPSLRSRPLAVTQKYLVVTCNYPARERGVTKLMATAAALKICPELALVNGEDLTPYRAASKALRAALAPFGTVQKLGLDECVVDVTTRAKQAASTGAAAAWCGHVHDVALGTSTAEAQAGRTQVYRPMDLRACAARAPAASPSERPHDDDSAGMEAATLLLMHGTAIAAEARAAVRAATGLRCSAGIAHNPLLAKLVSGLHKPDDQTALRARDGCAFVAPLPIRALPGVGATVERALQGVLGVRTAGELRAHSLADVSRALAEGGASAAAGGRSTLSARALLGMAVGRDPTAVRLTAPPASLTVEDSFRPCESHAELALTVRRLAPDLLARLAEEQAETGRRARTLVVKWRARGGRAGRRVSRSAPMPTLVYSRARRRPSGAAPDAAWPQHAPSISPALVALERAASAILREQLREPFALTLLSLGATAFGAGSAAEGAAPRAAGFVAAAAAGPGAVAVRHSPGAVAGHAGEAAHAGSSPCGAEGARPPSKSELRRAADDSRAVSGAAVAGANAAGRVESGGGSFWAELSAAEAEQCDELGASPHARPEHAAGAAAGCDRRARQALLLSPPVLDGSGPSASPPPLAGPVNGAQLLHTGVPASGTAGAWACPVCTFVNCKPEAPVCEVCASERSRALSVPSAAGARAPEAACDGVPPCGAAAGKAQGDVSLAVEPAVDDARALGAGGPASSHAAALFSKRWAMPTPQGRSGHASRTRSRPSRSPVRHAGSPHHDGHVAARHDEDDHHRRAAHVADGPMERFIVRRRLL